MDIKNLGAMKLSEIREIAKQLEIKSITTYNKEELINVISATQNQKSLENSKSDDSENSNSKYSNSSNGQNNSEKIIPTTHIQKMNQIKKIPKKKITQIMIQLKLRDY